MQSFGPIAPHYDLLMATVPYRMWAEYFKLMLTRRGCPALKILDVCCGTGSVAEMLAFDGYQVTGFDLSEGMIRAAQEKAATKQLDIRYEVADATHFELGEKFEAAFSFFDSLNYIPSLEGFRAAVQQVAQHLEPDGLFVFDLNTAYAFEQEMFTQSDMRKKSTLKYEWVGKYDPTHRIIKVEMDFWTGADHLKEVHIQRAHSDDEVRTALKDAGFVEIECFESYTLRKPRKSSDRIHYVAKLHA